MEIQMKHAKLLENNFRCYQDVKDAVLLLKLKRWRKKIAEQKKVFAFMILHDKYLCAVAYLKPTTMQALKMIKGFGDKNTDSYGNDIITIVKQHQ
jgi:ATP-dependent DNA helicase RecQ